MDIPDPKLNTMSTSEELKRLLSQIADIAKDASHYAGQLQFSLEGNRNHSQNFQGCTPKGLPNALEFQAIELAIETRADNAPRLKDLKRVYGNEQQIGLEVMALHTSRYWEVDRQSLTVSFLDETKLSLQTKILHLMNLWSKECGPKFVRTTNCGDIRISNQPTGSWAYVGTDSKLISPNRATTNIDGIAETTSDAKLRSLVLQLTGHLLGLKNRPLTFSQRKCLNLREVVRYLEKASNRSPKLIELELLGLGNEPVNDGSSIMSWKFPGWLTGGEAQKDATNITTTDQQRLRQIYPG